jgi:hypothetical protein
VFQLIGGALSKKGARLEVLFDDGELLRSSSCLLSLTLARLQDTGLLVRLQLVGLRLDRTLTVTFFADSTEPARSTHAVWDEIGEAVIRELDYSHIVLKLNT